SWFADTILPYEGTRLGRQEIGAEYIDDAPGALWQRSMFEAEGFRVAHCPHLRRAVVAVDPPASSGGESALAGIVVSGLGHDGQCYVLEDCSGRMSPGEWAARAVKAYDDWAADRIMSEANQGGEMVRHT